MPITRDAALEQLSRAVIDSNNVDQEFAAIRLITTIRRLAPAGSYQRELLGDVMDGDDFTLHKSVGMLRSVLMSLHSDYRNNELTTFTELVHADTFSDMMGMSEHLYQQGYKDAAAVIGGTVLEQHLRSMCIKAGVAILDANGKPIKAEAMNVALVKASVYATLDQKNVTAWLAIRNDAAHGNYSAYTEQQVRLLIDAVRDFIARFPA